MIKAGFLIGGRGGHGLIATRDRNGAWSGVTFVDLGGASFGLQAGVESTDVVLVFKTRNSLDRVLSGRGKLKKRLGVDAAIAAGPVGRQAEAGTDARLRAEIVSYSRSRGLFAGVALDGAAIVYDRRTNAEYLNDHRPEVVQLTINLSWPGWPRGAPTAAGGRDPPGAGDRAADGLAAGRARAGSSAGARARAGPAAAAAGQSVMNRRRQ